MGFSSARMQVATAIQVSGTIPAPGNAPNNTLRDPSTASPAGTTQTLTYGTSSGKIDTPCYGEYVIAASGTLTLNLYDGGATTTDFTTVLSTAANLRRLKSIAFAVLSGGDSSGVTIGGGSNAFASFWATTFTIFLDGPTASFGSPAGAAITSTTKNIRIVNNGAAEVVVQVAGSGNVVEPGYWTGFWGFMTYP